METSLLPYLGLHACIVGDSRPWVATAWLELPRERPYIQELSPLPTRKESEEAGDDDDVGTAVGRARATRACSMFRGLSPSPKPPRLILGSARPHSCLMHPAPSMARFGAGAGARPTAAFQALPLRPLAAPSLPARSGTVLYSSHPCSF